MKIVPPLRFEPLIKEKCVRLLYAAVAIVKRALAFVSTVC